MKNEYHLLGWLVDRFTGFFTRRIFIFVFVALLQPPVIVYAQDNTSPETENRLKKEAEKYFDKGDFMEAYPLYSQLLSLYPRDPNYNYRFGACLLYTRADKNKAVDYLEFSVEHPPVEDLAYYYLGRALHLNYRFNEAVGFYKKFEQTASSSELKKYPVNHFIEMCANGRELLANLHGLDVLRKKELNYSDYMEAYNMRANGGSLLSEPDIFKTKLDKEKKESNFIYLTPDKSEAFFSSYGNKGDNGKDIYEVKRDANGNWGAPENLGDIINTTFDEDYPVYDAPRNILYFSSKGHNSMGGYDIFKSVYNDSSDTWSEPENLDFPINTPDDDILFIPDTTGKTAFFASTRSSPQDMIDVYKIVLHLHPPQSLVVAGAAYQDDGKTPASCKITVRNIKTNDVVGVYKSSAEDGKYSFSLPNGGSYNFTIEDSNHKTQSQPVVLPVEETMSAMKQDIEFDSSGALRIKNYPPAGGMPEDSDYRLAYNYIKEQAQMDVNVDTNSVQTLLAQNIPDSPNTNSNNNANGNNPAIANTDSIQLAQDEQPLNIEAANAIDYAGDKMEEARQMEVRADNILNNQNGNTNSDANPDSVAVAKKILKQSATLEEKGMEAYRLAAAYKSEAVVKQSKTNTAENSSSSTVPDTSSSGQASLNNQTSAAGVSPGNLIREQAEQLKEDSSEVAYTNDSLNTEINELQQKSQSFVAQAGQTSNSQEKVALLQQADDLSKSRQVKQEEIKENRKELQQLHDEYAWLNSKAQLADSIVNKGDTANPVLKQEIDEYVDADNSDSASTGNNSIKNPANEIAANNENPNSSNKNILANTTSHFKHSHNRKHTHPASQPANIATSSASVPANTNVVASSQTVENKDTSSVSVPVNTNVIASSPTVENKDTSGVSVPVNTDVIASSQTVENKDASGVLVPVNTNVTASPQTVENKDTSGVSVPVNTDVIASSQTVENKDTSGVLVPANTDVIASSPTVENKDTSGVLVPVNTNVIASSPTVENKDTSGVLVPVNTDVIASSPTVENKDASGVSVPVNTDAIASPQTVENKDTSSVSVPVSTNVIASSQTVENKDASSVSVPVNTDAIASSPTVENKDTSSVSVQPKTIAATVVPLSKTPDSISSKGSESRESFFVSTVQYTDTVSVSLNQKSQNYFTTATSLTGDAEKTRNEARIEPDDNKSDALYDKADSLDSAASQLNFKGEETLVEANNRQYQVNLAKVTAIGAQPVKNQSDRISAAQRMLANADADYRKSLTASDSANNNTDLAVKHTYVEAAKKDLAAAILQEQSAISLYVKADSAQTVNVSHKLNSDSNIHFTYSRSLKTTKEKTVNIFEEVNASPYSVSNRIPIDPPLPTGVIFKVQVGAFRKPIPQNLFQGIEPVIGLKSPEGLIRYSAGLFSSFNPAEDALRKIRNQGYPGAFIVAFYNGKRITIKEALAKLGAAPAMAASESLQANSNGETAIIPGPVTIAENTIVPSKKTLIEEGRKAQRIIKDTVPPGAESFTNIKGLVFTVQVGSYSRHKGFIKLRKIKHLYYWTDKNGMVKYNSGTYGSIADAEVARNIIVANTPVKDAFVSAYYNGERITIKQAKDLLDGGNMTINNK